ncbi:MAG: hypothetical protein KAR06_11355, partial [Deltaproteobacteria bacterium]|nr:hypothetical protein [Deltaproteobacteria bacterium]
EPFRHSSELNTVAGLDSETVIKLQLITTTISSVFKITSRAEARGAIGEVEAIGEGGLIAYWRER